MNLYYRAGPIYTNQTLPPPDERMRRFINQYRDDWIEKFLHTIEILYNSYKSLFDASRLSSNESYNLLTDKFKKIVNFKISNNLELNYINVLSQMNDELFIELKWDIQNKGIYMPPIQYKDEEGELHYYPAAFWS